MGLEVLGGDGSRIVYRGWLYLQNALSSFLGFRCAVIVGGIQRLSNRVRMGNLAIIHKCDIADTPSLFLFSKYKFVLSPSGVKPNVTRRERAT